MRNLIATFLLLFAFVFSIMFVVYIFLAIWGVGANSLRWALTFFLSELIILPIASILIKRK
jgi:hypothetical protein